MISDSIKYYIYSVVSLASVGFISQQTYVYNK